jgi:hypothetical protein
MKQKGSYLCKQIFNRNVQIKKEKKTVTTVDKIFFTDFKSPLYSKNGLNMYQRLFYNNINNNTRIYNAHLSRYKIHSKSLRFYVCNVFAAFFVWNCTYTVTTESKKKSKPKEYLKNVSYFI